jgi:hypothetical protein
MASRRSSIKAQGTEVLVGVPRSLAVTPEEAPPAEPQAPEPPPENEVASTETPSPSAAESPPPEEDLHAALYEEARAAEPPPAQAEVPLTQASEWPPTPEMEMALIEQDRAATGSAQPAASPTQQSKSEAAMEQSDAAAAQSIDGDLLPPRSSLAYYETDIQGSEEEAERLELPERPLTGEEEQQMGDAASARLRKLDQEIDKVYEQVLAEVGDNAAIATECYNDLLRARDIVLRKDVSRLAQAEYYVELVRARLKRASTSGTGARRNAWWIFAWGLLWGMVLVSGLVLLETAYVQDLIALLNLRTPYVDPRILFPAMLWGGIGGVVAIWYSLFKHIAERDFDGNYNITYVGKPFFGLVLGATVYMIINLLIVSLGIWPTGTAEGAAQALSPTLAPWIIYLVSWVAGFKENRVFGLVDEVMKRIFPAKSATSSNTPMLP